MSVSDKKPIWLGSKERSTLMDFCQEERNKAMRLRYAYGRGDNDAALRWRKHD
jgi:hypothetical protein